MVWLRGGFSLKKKQSCGVNIADRVSAACEPRVEFGVSELIAQE
jgi:hypothetical protein